MTATRKDRSKNGPTPKRQRRKRSAIPDFVYEIQDAKGEASRQRQWRLDQTTGGNIPEYYDSVEYREDDESPASRIERRFLKVSGGGSYG